MILAIPTPFDNSLSPPHSPSLFRRKKCVNRKCEYIRVLHFFSLTFWQCWRVDFFKTINQIVQTTLKPSIHIIDFSFIVCYKGVTGGFVKSYWLLSLQSFTFCCCDYFLSCLPTWLQLRLFLNQNLTWRLQLQNSVFRC